MTRDELEHAIRAACDVAGDTELWVFGSQAILGTFPNAPPAVRTSIEVDVQPKNRPANADLVDGALGELSDFHRTFGFYVHGLSLENAKLPHGWKRRVVRVQDPVGTRGCIGLCLEVHDLAASKLAAYRDKDRDFVQTLLAEQLIESEELLERVEGLDIGSELRNRILDWLRRTVRAL